MLTARKVSVDVWVVCIFDVRLNVSRTTEAKLLHPGSVSRSSLKKGILKFNDKIIRIGKRCKSKILKNKLLHRILDGKAFEDMKSEKIKEINYLKNINKYIDEAVIGVETFAEFGIISEDIVSVINDNGGIYDMLNVKSSEAVVQKSKEEVKNEIDRLKKKKIMGKKGKMEEVEVEMKVTRCHPLGDEEVVNVYMEQKRKTKKRKVEFVKVLKPLCLTKSSSFQDNLAVWSGFKELCKTHPMSKYYINIFATSVEESKKVRSGIHKHSEMIFDTEKEVTKQLHVRLSLGEIHERLNPRLKHQLYLTNDMPATKNEAEEQLLLLLERDIWSFYRYAISQLRKEINRKLVKCKIELEYILEQMKLHDGISEEEVISSAQVIGMTTTGAAQFASSLENAFTPIIIVEEASEVLEAHIIAALNENVKHLIMIGDHKQLRPSPASFKMTKRHKLDISLFERMIINGLAYEQLLIQRRMRPEISQLIHPHIYKNLKNDSSVMGYPNVRGVGKNVFFVNHPVYEEESFDNPSKMNFYEAEMVLELARYLLLQEYSPDRITILTTYSAQLAHMKSTISDSERFHCLSDVRVCVVDNYQGEENDIILLSLVRSNKYKIIGFLNTENRVCVALSRAKMGFYCFGNFDMLSEISPLWRSIIETLKESSSYGEELPLYCQQHVEKCIQVKNADDFKLAPEGGTIVEKKVPDCRHIQKMECHVNPENFNCLMYVGQILPQCGHNVQMQCYADPEDFDCPIAVYRKIPSCGHTQKMACHKDLERFVCQSRCEKKLASCRHYCQKKCGEKCTEECSIIIDSKCGQDHTIFKKCSELDYTPCEKIVRKSLPLCGHVQNVPCHMPPEDFICKNECEETLKCGHQCSNECGQKCVTQCSREVSIFEM
ncbi:NFX1-type zinc finger-containing protein 1 [Nymphon striatum]|nr:NFX1-type zinc finger-containing protein 1 [Nymphon striatum]